MIVRARAQRNMADQAVVVQALIDATATAAAATAAIQAPAQQLPPILSSAVPFALNPGVAMNDFLDFTKPQGIK
jgi:hypothetical protein